MSAWLQPRQLMYVDDLCRWRAGGSAQVYLQPRPQQVRRPRAQIQAGQKTLSALKMFAQRCENGGSRAGTVKIDVRVCVSA